MHQNRTEYFRNATLFFNNVSWLYDTPVIKILSNRCLDLFPAEWLQTLKDMDINDLNNLVVRQQCKSILPKTFIEFLCNCQRFNILPASKIVIPPAQLPAEFKKRLSIKKQHEILHLAHLVHDKCQMKNLSLIVDLGAGLGYVCQLLNNLFGYKILGLESNPQNVKTAQDRQKTFFPNSLQTVKYICSNITLNSSENIKKIIHEEFGTVENVCLMGLHACGELSVSMSKIFAEMNEAQLLILVSCCYHKLTLKQQIQQAEYFHHFPLSKTFKEAIDTLNVDIGNLYKRPFLRLACQETADKWLTMSEEDHNKHSFYVLARAILELYGEKNKLYLKKLVCKGTRKSQCVDFETYLNDCTVRYVYENGDKELEPWTDEMKMKILNLWKKYRENQSTIELYTALQLIIQQLAESIVLLDRLCYLEEYDFSTEIIQVMDRSISPRCYAIISNKRLR